MNNHARVLFFATIREKAGVREANIEFPEGSQVTDIKNLLVQIYPNLKASMETIIVAMNHEFAFDEYIVPDGAEIAVFPPVSGGELDGEQFPTITDIVDQEIDLNRILQQITLPSTGAACIFTGTVREVTRRGMSRITASLEYEAYQEMAEAKMQQIVNEMRHRWKDLEGVLMIQRIGELSPGAVSVVIACTSSHRDSGIFEAAHYGIDRLKEIVPVWKKEIAKDGSEWVEGEYHPKRGE